MKFTLLAILILFTGCTVESGYDGPYPVAPPESEIPESVISRYNAEPESILKNIVPDQKVIRILNYCTNGKKNVYSVFVGDKTDGWEYYFDVNGTSIGNAYIRYKKIEKSYGGIYIRYYKCARVK